MTDLAYQQRSISVRTATVEVVVPVFNEERDVARSVERLDEFLAKNLPWRYVVTIADNASTDATLAIAERLAESRPSVRVVHLQQKGRGRALKRVWLDSRADVVAYMDVDLSTDLNAFLPLISPLLSGHSDIAIGTRLGRGSRVQRGPRREFISRSYNLLLRGALRVTFSDAQCGFKAMRTDLARQLLPLVEDDNWFFDTELLVLAQRAGMRIHEVPVDWVDDPDSTVDIVATAKEDLLGIVRLARRFAAGSLPLPTLRAQFGRPAPERGLAGQIVRFCVVGALSTLAYLLLFLLLRDGVGAQVANLVALVVTAIANTAANRAVTFGVRGRGGLLRDHLGGLIAFGIGLALTSGALSLLHASALAGVAWIEVAALVAANLVATLVRFLALRYLMVHLPAARAR